LKIVRVSATPLNIPVTVDVVGLNKQTSLSLCLTEIETDTGLVGHGMTAITEEEIIAAAVREVAGPALIGEDPMATERLWDKLYWLLSPRGQTGYASHTIAALDIALWDLKAKALGQPLWRLLGGARAKVPVYATFGFGFFERDQLAAAAKLWVSQGFQRLKMTVGNHALARRDEPRPLDEVIAEDVRRVAAVREAVGPRREAVRRCQLRPRPVPRHRAGASHRALRHRFFEEPLTQNDVRQMAQLRARTRIPLACGQNEGLAFRFRDLLVNQAADVLQPNVTISGGYSQCLKIAGMAQAFNVPIDNGGAWPFHNMHLHAGVSNGGLVEYHYVAVQMLKQIFDGLPVPDRAGSRCPRRRAWASRPMPNACANWRSCRPRTARARPEQEVPDEASTRFFPATFLHDRAAQTAGDPNNGDTMKDQTSDPPATPAGAARAAGSGPGAWPRALAVPTAWAQQKYPDKPIRLVVGYSAGGGVDAVARLLGTRLSTVLGQQVLVENRTGATGLIAADLVAKAPPDGYTLMMGDSALLIAKLLQPKIAIDPLTSFKPVAGAFISPLMIVTGNDFPAKTPAELVKELKAHPARYSFATSGVGTVQHLGFEMLKQSTGSTWCTCRTAARRRSCPT
jgi:L-rhamnonate dehydratase